MSVLRNRGFWITVSVPAYHGASFWRDLVF